MPSLDLLPVFNAQPGATLLLSPEWVIVGASDDYLDATLTQRDTIVGQFIFDAFPDNPQTPEANAVANVRASLAQVLATKQPHDMAPQHYDVPDHTRPGQFIERYWKPRHTPVLDPAGQVQFIIQSVQDITASRLAERQLRESQAREQQALAEVDAQRRHLQQVLRHLPAQIATYRGPEHLYDFVNTRYTQPLPDRHYLGRPFREVLPEVAAQGLLAVFDHVYRTGEPYHLAEQELWLDLQGTGQPEQLYLDFFLYPLRDAEGHIYGLLDFTYNVTAQVRARQQVQQLNDKLETRVLARTCDLEAARHAAEAQQHYLRNIFEQAPVAICLLRGSQAVVELLNQQGATLVGSTPAQVVGRPIREALPILHGQGFEELYQRVLQGETLVFQEMPITFDRAHTGQSTSGYYHHTYQPWREEAGAIVGVINIGVEVTEQVRARRQVQRLNEELTASLQEAEQQRARLRVLTDALPVLIGYLDEERRYQFTNEAYRTWFHRDPAALLGQRVRDIVGEAAYAATSGYMDRALAGERLHFESRMVYRADFVKYIHTDYIPDVHQGRVRGFYTLVTDVTEQALAREQMAASQAQVQQLNEELHARNQELLTANRQLTRTNADLDNFIYTASHDLKAPISNIEGLLLLLRDLLPEAVRANKDVAPVLGLMQGAVERFTRTIAHLTDVTKLQLEFAQPAVAVSLAAVVEDVRQDLRPLLTQAGAQLELDLNDCRPHVFSEKNLRSILYNLLSNALKYRAPGRPPLVRIACRTEGPTMRLTVQDNGLGLNAQQQTRLFQLFQRLHTHVEGTGLGLYMVKRIVENAGGTLAVQSQVNVGTTFTLTFPA